MRELGRFFIKDKVTKLCDEVIVFDNGAVLFARKTVFKHFIKKINDIKFLLFKKQNSRTLNQHEGIIYENIMYLYDKENRERLNAGLKIINYTKLFSKELEKATGKKITKKKRKKKNNINVPIEKINYIG